MKLEIKRNLILELIVISILLVVINFTLRTNATSNKLKLDSTRYINFTTVGMGLKNLVLENTTDCNLIWSTTDTDIIDIVSVTDGNNPRVNIKMKKSGTAKLYATAKKGNKIVAQAYTTIVIGPALETKAEVGTTNGQVNFRKSPKVSSDNYIQKNVPAGTKLTILQKNVNGTSWHMVQLNGVTGYMSSNYITEESSAEPVAVNSGAFVSVAQSCKQVIKDRAFTYGSHQFTFSKETPKTTSIKVIDCSGYVSWVLYEYGKQNNISTYEDLFSTSAGASTIKSRIDDNIKANGNTYFKYIGKLNQTKTSDLKAGDILIYPGSHIEIFVEYNKGYYNTKPNTLSNNNIYVCYSAGGKNQIRHWNLSSYGCCNDSVSNYYVYRVMK